MIYPQKLRDRFSNREDDSRRGSIVVLSAVVIVVVLAFTAFTVDIGFISLTKAELRNASDAAALAATQELSAGLGINAQSSADEVANIASLVAQNIAAMNPAGDLDGVHLNTTGDIKFGQLQWDDDHGEWVENWGAEPYTLIEVTAHRDRGEALDVNGQSLDGPLPLFFAPVIGHSDASLVSRSAAAVYPGGGFRIDENSSAHSAVLPIALDVDTWEALMAGTGNDDYGFDESLGTVNSNGDGIIEANLYPSGASSLPPGNRGTVDFGSPNNSTNDLKRQIREGLNADDLSWFGGELRFDATPLEVNGDPGVSAGIKDALNDIIGEVRAIPLFTDVSGPGNNAMYTISRFVGIRIMNVKLTGNPNKRAVVIQPAPFTDSTVVRGRTEIREDSIFTTPALIR